MRGGFLGDDAGTTKALKEFNTRLASENERVEEMVREITQDIDAGEGNDADVKQVNSAEWFVKYVRNVQVRMVETMEAESADIIRFHDVDACTDKSFEGDVLTAMKNEKNMEYLDEESTTGRGKCYRLRVQGTTPPLHVTGVLDSKTYKRNLDYGVGFRACVCVSSSSGARDPLRGPTVDEAHVQVDVFFFHTAE